MLRGAGAGIAGRRALVSVQRPLGAWQREGRWRAVVVQQQQGLFGFGGNNGNRGGNSSRGRGKDKDKKDEDASKEEKKDEVKVEVVRGSGGRNGADASNGTGGENGNGGPPTGRNGGAAGGSSFDVASMGFGDAAPRPERVLGLGLSRRPLFPGMVHSLTLSGDAARAVAAERQAGRPYVGLFLRKDLGGGTEEPELLREVAQGQDWTSVLHGTGTFGQIHTVQETPDGNSQALILVHRRIDLDEVADLGPPPKVKVKHWDREVWEPQVAATEQQSNDDVVATADRDSSEASGLATDASRDAPTTPTPPPPPTTPPPREERRSDKRKRKRRGDTSASSDDVVRALSNEIVAAIRELVQMNPLYREHMQFFAQRVDIGDPYKLADFAAALATGEAPQLQQALEASDVTERLRLALELVSKERELSKLQQEISQQVDAKITSQQRTFMLNEQLKAIKKELGLEQDDKEALIQKYQDRIALLDDPALEAQYEEQRLKEEAEAAHKPGAIPVAARKAIDEELAKLQMLEKNSAEFNVTRSYLDWLTGLPWGRRKPETFDVTNAREVLDAEHYGMSDVKDRILELVAVGALVGSVKGKILCFVGPPGVGKTSIAQSIAQALNRDFARFSVGGLHDVAEIKGHRRTYVGAMPGKPIQSLKTAQSVNPLVLLDEIDKLGAGRGGDPASALLELLDPSQNSSFLDHYLDVPVDMSDCLFVCTANVEHTIPAPLLDRMEIIRLAGYDLEEKLHIARRHLIPKVLADVGLGSESAPSETLDAATAKDDAPTGDDQTPTLDVGASQQQQEEEEETTKEDPPSITDGALRALIRGHAREAGVRSLQKLIEQIGRKLALKKVQGAPVAEVNSDNLADFVGAPKFPKDRLYDAQLLPNGVVCGLAWTSMGGSTLYVEAAALGSKRTPHLTSDTDDSGEDQSDASSSTAVQSSAPRLVTTGQLGGVMEESSRVALAHVRSLLARASSDKTGHLELPSEIHVHVPEGATPKDGPSAGVTMATALVSLALDAPVRSDLAMTGELSLTGRVLPVGGIKEKVIAARRAHIHHVCLPDDNRRDFDELPDYLKEGLTPHFAQTFRHVLSVAFAQPIPPALDALILPHDQDDRSSSSSAAAASAGSSSPAQ